MDAQLLFICVLTFTIHLIGTLAYAVRIAGVRTRRVAVSLALFNVLVLVSRTSNSFQGPFLARRIEGALAGQGPQHLLMDFRWLLLSATLASIAGAFLIPSFQRLFSRAVNGLKAQRSLPRLLLRAACHGGLSRLGGAVRVPAAANLRQLRNGDIPAGLVLLNTAAVALWTVGVFASLYAGYLDPELRVTASTLSSVVNGVATILLLVFIDPQLSVMTDDVVEGRVAEPRFRRTVVWLAGSRVAGTLLAQLLLVPAAWLVVLAARLV